MAPTSLSTLKICYQSLLLAYQNNNLIMLIQLIIFVRILKNIVEKQTKHEEPIVIIKWIPT